MKSVKTVQDKKTKEIKLAVYAPNRKGNKQYHIDGKPLTDKQFDAQYTIIS